MNREELNAYNRKRYHERIEYERARREKYYKAHREEKLAYAREYHKLHPDVKRRSQNKIRDANREVYREDSRKREAKRVRCTIGRYDHSPQCTARWKFREAIEHGRIIRPSECSCCHHKGRIHGHHIDYDKPYEVIWLCSICHGKIHRLPN